MTDRKEMTPDLDPNNPTYNGRLSKLFGDDGQLDPFQQRKYLPSIQRLADAGVAPASRILDVGVGYGAFLWMLKERGHSALFGMDPFPESIRIAGEVSGAQILEGSIEDAEWPYDEGSFDVITSFDVIEHLERPAVFFERAARYVRPGGLVLATTPLKEIGYRMRRLPWLGRKDSNPTHINVHPPKYWLDLVADSELELVEQWRGENLTHVRYIQYLGKLCDLARVDPRRVPVIRSFEQSFCLLLKRP